MPRSARRPHAALLVCAFALCAHGARAQAPEATETSVAAPALRRIDLEAHTPMRVLTRQDLRRQSHLGLGEILQRLPFMGGGAVNLNSNAGGDGTVAADIGTLGRARCVVMLNGHRLPVNELLGAPAVDLDAIPLASIDRVEIFLGGASPAWGADAVAGVINIITRAEAEGADLSVSSSRSTHGDAEAHRASLFAGKVFGRGYADATIEYRKRDPIDSSARTFSSLTQALGCLDGADCRWPFGSPSTPSGAFLIDGANALGLAPGRYTPDGSGGFRPFVSTGPQNDLYSTQGETFLRAGRRGASASARVGYELTDATQFTVDLLAARDRSRRRLAALPLITSLNGAVPQATSMFAAMLQPVRVSADNYYNPFGVEVREAQRRLVELGPRSVIDDSDMTFAAGTIRHAGHAWQLEATAAWGESKVSEHISHSVRNDRLQLALGPSGPDAAGNIRCGARNPSTGIVDAPIPDCVPLNLFQGPGSISAAMLDYITAPRTEESRLEHRQASLIARREISTGAGRPAAQLALGLETRTLTAEFELPDSMIGISLGRSPGGSVDQQDLIAELAWPVSEPLGAGSVLSVGARLSRFESRSTNGSGFAALTWRWHPDVLARGRFTQVYRAPSAGELFLGRRERVVPIFNPCLGGVLLDTTVCSGSTTNIESTAREALYFVGGNPQLRPERGHSTSAGIVWNSHERRERFVSLDATWTELRDAIRAPGALELIAACDGGRNTAACARLSPSILGSTLQIDGSLINGGRDESARLDFEARDGGSTRWGDWRAELFASYLLRRRIVDVDGERLNLRGVFDVTQSATGTAYPVLEGQARIRWSRAPWGVEWSTQYVGAYDEVRDRNGLLTGTNGKVRGVGAAVYHDFALSWSPRPSWTVRFNVENLFDREPPFVNNGFEANTDAPTYRVEGRLLSASFDVSL